MSEATRSLLLGHHTFEDRGGIEVKGKVRLRVPGIRERSSDCGGFRVALGWPKTAIECWELLQLSFSCRISPVVMTPNLNRVHEAILQFKFHTCAFTFAGIYEDIPLGARSTAQ